MSKRTSEAAEGRELTIAEEFNRLFGPDAVPRKQVEVHVDMTKEEIAEKFKEFTAKECFTFRKVEGTPKILDDKLGGLPYLPMDVEYPRDKMGYEMQLILQLDLAHAKLKGFPDHGIFEIFTNLLPLHWKECKILYFDHVEENYQTDFSELRTTKFRTVKKPMKIVPVPAIEHFNDVNCIEYDDADLRFREYLKEKGIAVPEEDAETDVFIIEQEKMLESFDECGFSVHDISFGGHPSFTQDDPRWYPGDGSGEPSAESADWECVFKLKDSFDEDIYLIGPEANLNVFILPKSIADRSFKDAAYTIDFD